MTDAIRTTLQRDELNTVLAALRLYQSDGNGCPTQRPSWLNEIACPTIDDTSLDDNMIDELCERLQLVDEGLSPLTEENVITALCIWEAVSVAKPVTSLHKAARWILDDEGAYSARDICTEIAPLVDAVWSDEDGEDSACDGITFDWEFIPMMLVYWHGLAGRADLRPREAYHLIDKAARAAIVALLSDLS